MEINGMPERFWVVTKPAPGSELVDVCFACTFERLLLQGRGGLQEDEIVGIFADEDEAKDEAMLLLGKYPVRPQDAVAVEVLVHVMVIPKSKEMTARELGEAAVEAVRNAVRLAEERGHQHHLGDQVSRGISEVMELRSLITAVGETV